MVSGTTACWDELLNSFPTYKRTVYGLIDPYLTGDNESMHMQTREMISTYYVAAIQSKQPKGPYTLMGYSQGGQWTWSTADVLINDKKETVEQLVLLDPVYPTWDHGRLTKDFFPKVFPSLMPASFYIPEMMLRNVVVPTNNSGFGVGICDGKTEAKRAAHMAVTIANAQANINFLEFMLLTAELDTGSKADTGGMPYMAFLKAQPKEKRFAAAMEAFAKGFPGVTVEYVTKVFEVFAVSAFRASLTSPCVLPKETKVLLINPERIGYKARMPWLTRNTPLSLVAYESYSVSIAKEQELYDYCAEGNLTEINTPLPAEFQGSAKALGQLVGEMGPFAGHFRVTHEPDYIACVKKEAFEPLGIV